MLKEANGFVFPGQGSQEVGMGKRLLENEPIAHEVFGRAEEILEKRDWNRSLRDICLHGPAEFLNRTEITQPAILTVSIAANNVLRSNGVVPKAVVGHSLGEYSALVAASSINFSDAVGVVVERGSLMKQAGELRPGSMAAVMGLPLETVETLCQRLEQQIPGSIVQVANINSDSQIVISGDREAIRHASDFAKELGALKTVVLPVTIAGHSSLMEHAAQEMVHVLNSIAIVQPKIPFYSPTTGNQVNDPQTIKNLLIVQLTGRVLWTETIRNMIAAGYTSFLEVGHGKTLTQLIRRIDKRVQTESANT